MGSLPPDVVAYQLAHKDEDIGSRLIATSVIFGSLALLCVTARITSRHMGPGAIGMDDYLVVVAMVRRKVSFVADRTYPPSRFSASHCVLQLRYVSDSFGKKSFTLLTTLQWGPRA
jgi:hypothetical protein